MFDIFEYQFMQYAFIAGFFVAVIASVIGSFVVLRRYSMISDTLAHVALVGVALGLLIGTNPLWSAVIVALLMSWLIEYLRYIKKLYSDSVMAIFMSGSLAIAVTIISIAGANNSLMSYLFGNILTVTLEDIITIVIFSIASLFLIMRYYHQLLFVAYDEEVAQTSGINVSLLNFLLMTIVALVVALSIRVVGSLLIGALMIIPVMAALQFKQSFLKSMFLSVLISTLSVLFGLIISYYFELPSGAAIVLVTLLFFTMALLFKRS
jgi:zinc transport system permease protein